MKLNFTSDYYLPNSEERIEHLRKIVNNRPVVILVLGPSIKKLENRINELRCADVCYFGLCGFWITEKYILKQIDKRLSVIMCSPHDNMPKDIGHIVGILDRNEDNIFISSKTSFCLLGNDFYNQFINKYDRKLFFFIVSGDATIPNSNYPLHFYPSNSLLVLIQIAIIGRASSIILFGADGGYHEGIEYYYHQEEYNAAPLENIIADARNFNVLAPGVLKNVYDTYNIEYIDILNCSDNSFYTYFPKVSYDKAFDLILKK